MSFASDFGVDVATVFRGSGEGRVEVRHAVRLVRHIDGDASCDLLQHQTEGEESFQTSAWDGTSMTCSVSIYHSSSFASAVSLVNLLT